MRRLLFFVFCLLFPSLSHAVTPLAANAELIATAPDDCWFYFHNAGFTDADPNTTNKTERLMMEASVKTFIKELKSVADQAMEQAGRQAGPDDAAMMKEMTELGKVMLNRPFTFYVGNIDVRVEGRRVRIEDVDMGLVLDAGNQVDEVEKQLKAFQDRIPDELVSSKEIGGILCNSIEHPNPEVPDLRWAKVKQRVLVSAGKKSMESLIANIAAPAPAWMASATKRVEVPRRWTMTHANVRKFTELLENVVPPEATDVMTALGLMEMKTLDAAAGLDADGVVSRSYLATDSDHGLLSLFDQNGITAKDLEEVPKDAVACAAIRMDPAKVVDMLLDMAIEISPEDGGEVESQLQELSDAIGVDIREEIAGGLGDRWLIYITQGVAGPMVPNVVIAADVRDASGVGRGLTLLKNVVNQQNGMFKISNTKVGDKAANYLKGAPIVPAWCLTKDRLVIGMQKSLISKFLDSPPKAGESLATEPRVAELFKKYEKPMLFTYSDAKTGMAALLQSVPLFLNMSAAQFEQQGIEIDVTNLPAAADVVKHLDPSVGVIHRDAKGIESTSRRTIPTVSVGTAAPVAVGLLLPAVSAARVAAQRTQSINNMRQIGLACFNYESAMQHFPAQKVGDGDVNGLSWRVAILPYIEQNDLYNQFNLDEPWDSEHNKELIEAMPAVFRSPRSRAKKGYTNYLAVGGDDGIISGEGEGIKIRAIKDGTSKTAMAVEVDDSKAVPWTKPVDFEWDDDPSEGLGGLQIGGFITLIGDGSVRFIAKQIDKDVLEAMFTKSGGEAIDVP